MPPHLAGILSWVFVKHADDWAVATNRQRVQVRNEVVALRCVVHVMNQIGNPVEDDSVDAAVSMQCGHLQFEGRH